MLDGTSMSAPIVSGAVALALSIKPDIKVEQIIGTMQQTGKKTDRYVPPMLILDKFLEAVKMGILPMALCLIMSITNRNMQTKHLNIQMMTDTVPSDK